MATMVSIDLLFSESKCLNINNVYLCTNSSFMPILMYNSEFLSVLKMSLFEFTHKENATLLKNALRRWSMIFTGN